MANNFLQWNPTAANQEADAAYAADSQRSGGATTDAIFASNLGNKLFYQLSTFVAAMAAALTAKGYVTNDGSASPSTALANLQAVLSSIMTATDVVYIVDSSTQSGCIQFGPVLGNLQITWGKTGAISPTAGTVISMPVINSYGPNPVVLVTPASYTSGWVLSIAAVTATARGNFTLAVQGSGISFAPEFFYIAIGTV